mmetsp:Transcript_69324/g.195499  ORF Transcript_69324/g.195499 Transcript_69324/m.195499 type:complete len:214 (+) Transcript_69324:969-1610(+)
MKRSPSSRRSERWGLNTSRSSFWSSAANTDPPSPRSCDQKAPPTGTQASRGSAPPPQSPGGASPGARRGRDRSNLLRSRSTPRATALALRRLMPPWDRVAWDRTRVLTAACTVPLRRLMPWDRTPRMLSDRMRVLTVCCTVPPRGTSWEPRVGGAVRRGWMRARMPRAFAAWIWRDAIGCVALMAAVTGFAATLVGRGGGTESRRMGLVASPA